MLAKLLKYEIPAMGRKLMPLFIAWLAASVLLGVSIGRLQNSGFFVILSPLVYGMVTTAVVVMFIILIIQRYNTSLLGDEAYFNLTLPVSINEHIANKAISALIWTVITCLAALLSVLIIGIASGAIGNLFDTEVWSWKDFFGDILHLRGSDLGRVILVFTETLIVGVFNIVKSILAIYAAITIGHQASSRTTLASIGAYIVLMMLESAIGSVFINLGIMANVNMNLAESMTDLQGFHLFMAIGLIVSLGFSALYFFICKYLMEKRLNLA